MDTFIREETPDGYEYGTPAGYYRLRAFGVGWTLHAGRDGSGRLIGTYGSVGEAERALEAVVRERMWH